MWQADSASRLGSEGGVWGLDCKVYESRRKVRSLQPRGLTVYGSTQLLVLVCGLQVFVSYSRHTPRLVGTGVVHSTSQSTCKLQALRLPNGERKSESERLRVRLLVRCSVKTQICELEAFPSHVATILMLDDRRGSCGCFTVSPSLNPKKTLNFN